MPGKSYNPRDPELTYAEIEQAVDALLHVALETCEETCGFRTLVAEQLKGCSPAMQARIRRALDRRLDRYKSSAHKINL